MSIDNFIQEVCEGVNNRKAAGKYDAYFYIPDDMNYENIKIVIKRLDDEYQITSRLYEPLRLQAFWTIPPRRNPFEFIAGISAIIDPDMSMQFFA